MVDVVTVRGRDANCQEDVDGFPLKMSSIGNAVNNQDAPPVNFPQLETFVPASAQSVLEVMTLPSAELSIQECNIVAYLGGGICRKTNSKLCVDCQANMICKMNKSSDSSILGKQKLR